VLEYLGTGCFCVRPLTSVTCSFIVGALSNQQVSTSVRRMVETAGCSLLASAALMGPLSPVSMALTCPPDVCVRTVAN
jgi:hypothetical protein